MNGHRELLTMRRAGFKPEAVRIADFPCPTDWAKWGNQPTVCVDGDTPELEDFRFLLGTIAIVDGYDAERVARITKACQQHAARVIAAVYQNINEHRVEMVRLTDTEGLLTWPQ